MARLIREQKRTKYSAWTVDKIIGIGEEVASEYEAEGIEAILYRAGMSMRDLNSVLKAVKDKSEKEIFQLFRIIAEGYPLKRALEILNRQVAKKKGPWNESASSSSQSLIRKIAMQSGAKQTGRYAIIRFDSKNEARKFIDNLSSAGVTHEEITQINGDWSVLVFLGSVS